MTNHNPSVSHPSPDSVVSPLVDLGLETIIQAIFIFGGSILYLYEVMERYSIFFEIKSLHFFTAVLIIASFLLYSVIKNKDRYSNNLKELLLFWAISLILVLVSGFFTYQKLDHLSINPERFFGNYVSYYVLYIIFSAFIAFAVHWLYGWTKNSKHHDV